jgi:DNA-binding NarL/FixJ family response regulator
MSSSAAVEPDPPQAGEALHPVRALEAIGLLHHATNPPELLDAMVDATKALGAAASLYSVEIPEAEGEPYSFSLFACHPAFAHRQEELGPLHHHPWLRFARTHSSPATDRTLESRESNDLEALALARQYGFTSCLIVPTASGTDLRRVEVLCLGSPQQAAFEGEDARLVRTLARSLAAELHDWVSHHLSERLQRSAQLRPSDIELLKMEWQGLGTKAICNRTGMSSAAVDSRFQRLNYRLDCTSRKEAARKAAERGLLEHP